MSNKIKTIVCIAAAALLVVGCSGQSQETRQPSEGPSAIGTFDSRAVSTAYYRSDLFEARLAEMRDRFEKAKAAGDTKLVKALGDEGPAVQALAHRQTFCAAPVPEILERIRGELPAIAKKAGVEMIVSKWDLAYRDPSARTVDVTDHLVQLFKPDAATLKVIDDLSKMDPLPLTAVENHDH